MNGDAGTPISVYLQLKEGEVADWEAVAKASIEFIEALKDLAQFADPSAKLKVTLQNSKEGSLRFNAIIELFGSGGDPGVPAQKRRERHVALKGILWGAGTWLLLGTASHYLDALLSKFDEAVAEWMEDEVDPDPASVEEVKQECRKLLEDAARNQIGASHVRKFFAELKADENITGVAITDGHDGMPDLIIPRSEFGDRSRPQKDDAEPINRTRVENMTVLLVEPRLLGDEKSWRFSVGGMEFGAKVDDKDFVNATLSGRNGLPLKEGIFLDVKMKIDERREENVWVVKSRTILEVISFRTKPEQGSFADPI